MNKGFICFAVPILIACTISSQKNTSAPDWVQLFNGKDLSGWKMKISGHALNDNYGNTFRVENSVIKVSYDAYSDFGAKFGHLFYDQKFSNYLLAIEYRFTGDQAPGGPGWAFRNSGVMLHSQDPQTMLINQDFPISIEAQFLGGNGKEERTTANLCTPGTNVVIDGKLITNHCTSSKSKTFHGDQWVRMEALVLGDSVIEHFVNGESVLVYQKPQIGNENVSNSDPTVKKDGELLREGYIALQSESHPIEFRKVEIVDLSPYANNNEDLARILKQLKIR